MRPKRKLVYFVQDWPETTRETFWWNRKGWRLPVAVPDSDRMHFNVKGQPLKVGKGGASTSKMCYTLHRALHAARQLKSAGGEPLISRTSVRKGRRRWIDFHLSH